MCSGGEKMFPEEVFSWREDVSGKSAQLERRCFRKCSVGENMFLEVFSWREHVFGSVSAATMSARPHGANILSHL